MELREDPASIWADWNNRSWLIGLNASNDIPNDVVSVGLAPWVPQGFSECTNAWRGLSPLALNPNFCTLQVRRHRCDRGGNGSGRGE